MQDEATNLIAPHLVDTSAAQEPVHRLLAFMPGGPLARYIAGLVFILALIFALRSLAKTLEAFAGRVLARWGVVTHRRWLAAMADNKLAGHIFFCVGMVFLSSFSAVFLPTAYPQANAVVTRALDCMVYLAAMLAINAFLNVLRDGGRHSYKLPLKGITQAAKIFFWAITILIIISALSNKDPLLLLGGLTALSAVIMLVFKDAIVGLAAGFQLLANDFIRVGDWVSMSSQGADGTVVDVTLTTVRVQNWDNSIVNIPAYNMISNAFVNWRAMQESGARLIKRALHIDIKSVRFLTAADMERLSKIDLLKDYLAQKTVELAAANAGVKDEYNARRLTNIGTFRKYCLEYLKNNPKISPAFTRMTRQLAPASEGLPLEIYAYCTDTDVVAYEEAQADIFDHLFSIMHVFGLRAYQKLGDNSALQ